MKSRNDEHFILIPGEHVNENLKHQIASRKQNYSGMNFFEPRYEPKKQRDLPLRNFSHICTQHHVQFCRYPEHLFFDFQWFLVSISGLKLKFGFNSKCQFKLRSLWLKFQKVCPGYKQLRKFLRICLGYKQFENAVSVSTKICFFPLRECLKEIFAILTRKFCWRKIFTR